MADLSTLETIKASDKPTENDFSYIYAESANKAFIRIAKEELKKLILDGEYTNEEIDQKISTIPKFTTKVVSSLPTTDISETTVYLVSSGNDSENLYTEYININGLWEILGTQKSTFSGSAKDVTYDDTETKLGATNVQDAFGKLSATMDDKLNFSELPEAVNEALAQAKASGEFDGKDGYTPQKGIDYFDGQNGKDGEDGKDGADGKTPVKGTDYFTEADRQEIVEDVLEQVEIPSGGSSDVWEELINITTEEEVSYILQELENQSCFKRLSLDISLVGTPTNSGESGVVLETNKVVQWIGTEESLYFRPGLFGKSDVKRFITIELLPNGVQTVESLDVDIAKKESSNKATSRSTTKVTNSTIINCFQFGTQNHSNVFGVGSVIKLYGVRA